MIDDNLPVYSREYFCGRCYKGECRFTMKNTIGTSGFTDEVDCPIGDPLGKMKAIR